jgi:hypothetical protein
MDSRLPPAFARVTGNDKPLESADSFAQTHSTRARATLSSNNSPDWEASGKHGSKPKPPKTLPPLTAEELAELPELPEGWGWVTLAHIQSHDKYAVKAGPFGSALKKSFTFRMVTRSMDKSRSSVVTTNMATTSSMSVNSMSLPPAQLSLLMF